MPWYRQYFWLLLFGGIILVTAIISFAMICICRNKLSKSVRGRIQKTFKVKKRNIPTIVTENGIYRSTEPSKVQSPYRAEKKFVSPPDLHVVEQRIPPQGLYPGFYAKTKNTQSDIPYLNDRYSNASYDSVGGISEMNYSNEAAAVSPPNLHVVEQRNPPQGLYPGYYAKTKNTKSDIPYLNDRYSNASYDSVGGISEMNYSNEAAAAISENSISVLPSNMYAMVQKKHPKQPTWGLYPEYYAKTQKTNSDKPDPNDRFSYASYDSVGSISDVTYYNKAAAAVAKDREYVEVIPDGHDYDDVETSSPRSDTHLTNKLQKQGPFFMKNLFHK